MKKYIHLSKKVKARKGFTLIELLMVVAIIAILITIIMVVLNSSRERANVNKYVSYATQMHRLVADSVAAGNFDAGVLGGGVTLGTNYCLGKYAGTCWNGGVSNNATIDTALLKISTLPEITEDNAFSPFNRTYGVTMAITNDSSAINIRMYLLADNVAYLNKICGSMNWSTCEGDSCCNVVPLRQ